METVLGVERSLAGRRWRARGGDDRAGLAMAQRLGLPEIVGRLLAGAASVPMKPSDFSRRPFATRCPTRLI